MGVVRNSFSGAQIAALPGYPAVKEALAFMPDLNIVHGQLLGQVSAANATEIQTLTYSASPAGGTGGYTLSIVGPDGATYTSPVITGDGLTAGALATAINALLADAGFNVIAANVATGVTVTVTGTTTTGAFTITFAGLGVGRNMPALSATVVGLVTSGAAAITITMATTTAGVKTGVWGPYDGTKLANPTAAPVPTSKTGGTSIPVLYSGILTYTFKTAVGETLPSPGAAFALTTTDRTIAIEAITVPTGGTGVNYYIDGVYAATGDGTAKDITALATTAAKPLPTRNTAFTCTDGRHVAKAIAVNDFRTNNMGEVAMAGATQQPQWGNYDASSPAYFTGAFKTTELTGLTADAVDDLAGKIIRGTLSDGVLVI